MKLNRSQLIPDKIATAIIDELILGEFEYKNENDRVGVIRSIRTKIVEGYFRMEDDIAKIPDIEIEQYLQKVLSEAKDCGRLLSSELSKKRKNKLLNSSFIKEFIESLCTNEQLKFEFLC